MPIQAQSNPLLIINSTGRAALSRAWVRKICSCGSSQARTLAVAL